MVKDFPHLAKRADAGGQEHDVWFDLQAEPQCVWKATKTGQYGLVAGQSRLSTPLDYLDRLWIYELVLGFPWNLEGLWLDAYGRLRLVSSQPFMPGVPATDEQIHEYLASRGFFLQEDHFMGPMWVHADFEVVVGDAYPDNFVVLEDGSVMPVDLSIARYHF